MKHRWSDPFRQHHKTERYCINCGLVKVTRHPPQGFPWKEFWRGLDQIQSTATPACEPVMEDV